MIRFLRRKIVLGIIFGLSFCYCIYNFTKESPYKLVTRSVAENDEKPLIKLNSANFAWNSGQEDLNSSAQEITCRNSIQGKFLLVDDKGYVCRREDILVNGCCNINSSYTIRYMCDSCQKDNCCIVYEYCLSCCMDPNKKTLLKNDLSNPRTKFILSAVRDQFELCSVKCRTNSLSVFHESTYRNPSRKYCYG